MIESASRGWRPYALLMLLCLALYVPGIAALPVMDRDEARFAQATRQMLETGDYLRIRFGNEARNKKPVAIYWLQALAVSAVSDPASPSIWPYRLPSLAGAAAAVLLLFAFGARLVGRQAALIGAALLACSLGLTVEAHLAKTDAVLLATCVAAQGALGAIYLGERRGGADWRWALLFWVAQGLALLVKGPIAPLLSALTVLALSFVDRDVRWLRGLRPLWGMPLALAILAPWLVAISVATDGAFLHEALGHDFLGKLLGAEERHGAPPGYYLLLLFATFWPGALFLGGAFTRAWRERGEPETRFLIAWAVPFWLALELVPTKLPHYILPAFPALALLAGHAIFSWSAGEMPRRLERIALWIWAAAGLGFAAILFFAPFPLGRGIDAPGIVAAAVILVFGFGILRRAWRGLSPGLAVRTVLMALLVFPAAVALEAPRLDQLWLSRAAAAMVARYQAPGEVPVASVGYGEPSLIFLLGTKTRFVSAEEAADQIAAARGAVALVDSQSEEAFRRALAMRGWTARAIEQVAGLDYSRGRQVVLTLYKGVPG